MHSKALVLHLTGICIKEKVMGLIDLALVSENL